MTPDQLKRIEAMLADTDGPKECPFCGGEAINYGQVEFGGVLQTRIGCKDCGARSPIWGEGKSQQVWNTRAYLEPLRALYEENKRLWEALEKIQEGVYAEGQRLPAYEMMAIADEALKPQEET